MKVERGVGGDATYGRTSLDVESPDRISVVHCIKRGYLVHPHGGHLQQPGDFIHDADAREAVLPLTQIQQGHHGGFLVLRRVPFEDLGNEFLVDGIELERD